MLRAGLTFLIQIASIIFLLTVSADTLRNLTLMLGQFSLCGATRCFARGMSTYDFLEGFLRPLTCSSILTDSARPVSPIYSSPHSHVIRYIHPIFLQLPLSLLAHIKHDSLTQDLLYNRFEVRMFFRVLGCFTTTHIGNPLFLTILSMMDVKESLRNGILKTVQPFL